MSFASFAAIGCSEPEDRGARPFERLQLPGHVALAGAFERHAAGQPYVRVGEQVIDVPVELSCLAFRQMSVPSNPPIHAFARASNIYVAARREGFDTETSDLNRRRFAHIQKEQIRILFCHSAPDCILNLILSVML